MKRLTDHLRANVIGYLALFVALGGTGYAAVSIPRGSVGTRQLRNGAVTPVKLGKGIAGSVRAWAIVGPTGKVIAGGGRPRVLAPLGRGVYTIDWGVPIPNPCATVATVEKRAALGPTETVPLPGGNGIVPVIAGFVSQVETIGGSDRSGNTTPTTDLLTFNQAGQLAPLPFDVAVIC
ncbi:MAG TPA: hypothetical protein VG294_13090 [Solirubrobacteraceae bacterium]|jgi:hypothetical protein|nr:hypothetical protein [Solirubrobacteraceae bacterium]